MNDWHPVIDDQTRETVLRLHRGGELVGEIRPWPDGGVHWWRDFGSSSGHWGLAEDSDSAIGICDLLAEIFE
jgi:hypothetical protein